MTAKQAKNKYDNITPTSKYVGYGAIALLLGAVFVYYKGKTAGNTHAPLPKNTNSSETEASIVRGISLALHNEMKGIGFNGNIEPFEKYLVTTDRIFVAVYNDFNQMYQADGDGTLRDWINDEYWGIASQAKQVKESITIRMDNLNLQ